MKPDSSLPLYDLQSDEAIEIMIEDKTLWDLDKYLSYEMVRAWRTTRMFHPYYVCKEYIRLTKKRKLE